MTLPLCTYGYSQKVTEEEELAQSNERAEALRKISSYIDTSNNISFETIVEEFLNPKENKECDLAQVEVRYKFFEKVLQDSIEELKKAELKTKLLFMIYKEVNYCFDGHKRTVEKNFPNHTKKTIEKAIAQAYYALDVIRDERSIVEIFDIHPDKIYEISKITDFSF